ncbi:MAG TPA: sulfatase-like hydrolase/transferase [Mobilitalea sp.]|nr:sulfatase-like hydrolase/transferase [Mobilitalea sp.]
MERDSKNNRNGEQSNQQMGKVDAELKDKDNKNIDEDTLINQITTNINSMMDQEEDSDTFRMKNNNPDLSHNQKIENDSNSALPGKMQKIWSNGKKSLQDLWSSYVNISVENFLYPMLFIIGTMVYLEIVFHLLIYRGLDMKIINPVLLAMPIGLVISFITGLFKDKINKFILWIITAAICLVFNIQLIYFYIFKVYFSFQSLGMAGDAVTNFGKEIILAVKANIPGLILLFLPLAVLAFLTNAFDYTRRGIKEQVILLGSSAVFQIIAMVALLIFGKGDYTPYDLYYNSKVPDMCGKQLGIATMTRIDLSKLFYKEDDLVLADTLTLDTDPTAVPTNAPSIPTTKGSGSGALKLTQGPTQPPTQTPIDTSPNIMNIDFNASADNESNDTIKKLDQYFATITPTNKNKYTGMFKGYNLIMITAEGFSPYAINEQKTPTLYKLAKEGFVFNNFYTALWQTSTSDGEYVAMTGLIPNGTRSMYIGRKNLWPFSLGNQFDQLGIASKAYHDHTYSYYQRNETHPNLGYIYKANGNGLVLEHPNVWPESDVEMIASTVDEYTDEDQFHVYYLTVSGHMNYSFTGNMMSYKNKDLVADLPYSDDAKAYIACQIELDRALELLIKKLEEAGVADRTVIALSADHYPYGWEKYKLDELAGHVIDPNFEIYKNHFILWCEGMKENIVIDKPCSSMDILPTLSNLFGLEYDSRLLMGQDILSDASPLVFFSNRSFITDKVKYNSETGEVIKLTNESLPENYISNINKIIKNKFTVSKSILDEDYYRHIFPNYPE